jgi:TP901 family phage tail tape measure protein
MADDLKIKVTIQGDDKLSPAAKSASKSLEGVNKAADQTTQSSGKASTSINVLARGLAGPLVAGAAAVAGGLAYATTTAADFDKTISGVAAVTGASVDEMAQLRQMALDLGASTAFSAKEAAEGLGELAKGGVSIADIMGGAATAALNLAAAGGVEVADAAAIAANAMSLFNIEGKDMGKVVDAIAGFANATTGSVNDFRYSLASVGSVAHLMGQEFDQTAVAIGLMGKAGILGSDAGTSLKAMLNNLVPSTKAATEKMRELGLITAEGANQFLDAQGNFKDLRDISDILSQSIDGLSESEKASALETIFLQDGMRAATILAEAGGVGFDTMTTAMLENVSAAEVAKVRLDNLAGSMDTLNGSVETAAIELGTAMTPAVKEVTEALNTFTTEQVIPFIRTYGPAFGAQLSATVKFLGQVADAIGPIINVVGPLLLTFFSNWGLVMDTTIGIIFNTVVAIANLKNALGEFFDALGTEVRGKLEGLQGLISGLGPTLRSAAEGLGGQIIQGIVQGLNPGPVVAKLQGLAAQALAAAKNAVEAHSPSELFADEVGEPMAEGIALGVTRGEGAVSAAVEGIVSGALAAGAKAAAAQAKPPPDQSYGAGTGGGGTGGSTPKGATAPLAHTPFVLPKLGISAMADGGLVSRPTFALLGERGPEYVVPAAQARGLGAPLVIENYVMLDGQVIARSTRTVERGRAVAGPSAGIGGL